MPERNRYIFRGHTHTHTYGPNRRDPQRNRNSSLPLRACYFSTRDKNGRRTSSIPGHASPEPGTRYGVLVVVGVRRKNVGENVSRFFWKLLRRAGAARSSQHGRRHYTESTASPGAYDMGGFRGSRGLPRNSFCFTRSFSLSFFVDDLRLLRIRTREKQKKILIFYLYNIDFVSIKSILSWCRKYAKINLTSIVTSHLVLLSRANARIIIALYSFVWSNEIWFVTDGMERSCLR